MGRICNMAVDASADEDTSADNTAPGIAVVYRNIEDSRLCRNHHLLKEILKLVLPVSNHVGGKMVVKDSQEN